MSLSESIGLRSKRFRGEREQRKTQERDFRCFSCAKQATILDKINGTSGPPLPQFEGYQNGAFFAPSRLHHCFVGDGG